MKKMGMLLALCLLLPACAVSEGTGLPEALAALFEGEAAYAGYACTASDGETAEGDDELPPPEDYPLPEDRASRRVRGWAVSRYDPALRLFWDDDEYMLTLTDRDSGDIVGRYGLALGETFFGLINSEGSGAYRLLEDNEDGWLEREAESRIQRE